MPTKSNRLPAVNGLSGLEHVATPYGCIDFPSSSFSPASYQCVPTILRDLRLKCDQRGACHANARRIQTGLRLATSNRACEQTGTASDPRRPRGSEASGAHSEESKHPKEKPIRENSPKPPDQKNQPCQNAILGWLWVGTVPAIGICTICNRAKCP